MFDIRVGTMIPAQYAQEMLPELMPMGFECYELDFAGLPETHDFRELGKRVVDTLQGVPVSALGVYGNTLADEAFLRKLERVMDAADAFGCDTIGLFAGSVPGEGFDGSLPAFRKIFGELLCRAEARGLYLALENCHMGTTWQGGGSNVAFGPDAWDILFDTVNHERLGLEWEPCHAVMQLIDPIAQLRKWAPRVFHVHGKDGTVAWDVLREHGLNGSRPFLWNRTPGFGDTNWNDVFTILLQSGYTGFVDIEGYHDPVHYDDGEWSAQLRSLNYLKDCRGGRVFVPGPAVYRGYQAPKRR